MNLYDISGDIANCAVAGVSLSGATWGLWRWHYRPRFLCGVPPLGVDPAHPESVGRRSVTRGFVHHPRVFAQPIRGSQADHVSPRLYESLKASDSCRRVLVDEDGTLELPVLLENHGSRSALNLAANIVFLPDDKIRLRDAVAESLPMIVYAADSESLSPRARVMNADPSIRAAYGQHLQHGFVGDGVWLRGTLSANCWEMVVVKLAVADNCDELLVIYTIESTDGFVRARTWAQLCTLVRSPESVGRRQQVSTKKLAPPATSRRSLAPRLKGRL